MKIAVTYENGNIFQHFGHTENFKIYDIENGGIAASKIVNTEGSGHGELVGFLTRNGVDALICGGIGAGARNALAAAGIAIYGGAAGDADEQLEAFLRDELNFDPNATCNHHGDDHHHDHKCGEHHS